MVAMLAALVLLEVLLPPPLLVGSLGGPSWECSGVSCLGGGEYGGFIVCMVWRVGLDDSVIGELNMCSYMNL